MRSSLRYSRTRVQSTAVDVSAIALFLIAFFGHPLLLPGMMFHGGDPSLFAYPNRLLFREAIGAGVLPLWNPYAGLGQPALASYQGGFLYPLNWLLLAIPSPTCAENLSQMAHLLLQGFGMYGLIRFGLRLGRAPGVFAGVVQGVNVWNAAHAEHFMIVRAASWAPALLWVWIVFLRRRSPGAAVAAALCMAMAMLAGHPQYWIWTIYAMALLTVMPVDASVGWTGWLRRSATGLAALGLICIAATTLAAAQLIPTMELAQRSERETDDPDYATFSSFPPDYFLHYISPERLPGPFVDPRPDRSYTEQASFIGRAAFLLALAGMGFGWRRRMTWSMVALFAIPALIAVGKHWPDGGAFVRGLYEALPGWSGMRVTPRLLFMANIGLIALAAIGFAELLNRTARGMENRRRAVSWIATATLFLCAITFIEQYLYSFRFHLRHASGPRVEIIEEARLGPVFERRPGVYRIFRLIDPVGIQQSTPEAQAARIAILEPNTGIYAGVGTVRAFVEGLLPVMRTQDFLRAWWANLYTPRPDAELLGLMNVQFLASDKPIAGEGWRPVEQAAPFATNRPPITIFENLRNRGPVYGMPGNANPQPDLEGRFETYGTPSPKASAPRPSPDVPRSRHPQPRVRRINPNQLMISCSGSHDGDWIRSGTVYPGWTAIYDSGALPLEPLNAIQSSFPAQGTAIRLAFEPFSFRAGLFLSLTALGALIAWLVLTAPGAGFLMKTPRNGRETDASNTPRGVADL